MILQQCPFEMEPWETPTLQALRPAPDSLAAAYPDAQALAYLVAAAATTPAAYPIAKKVR